MHLTWLLRPNDRKAGYGGNARHRGFNTEVAADSLSALQSLDQLELIDVTGCAELRDDSAAFAITGLRETRLLDCYPFSEDPRFQRLTKLRILHFLDDQFDLLFKNSRDQVND